MLIIDLLNRYSEDMNFDIEAQNLKFKTKLLEDIQPSPTDIL